MQSRVTKLFFTSIVAGLAITAFGMHSALPDVYADCELSSDGFGLTRKLCGTEHSAGRAGWAGLQINESSNQSLLKAAGPVASIEAFAGEKSVRAGGDVYMSAALMFDAQGNPAADGTATHFTGNALAGSAKTESSHAGIAAVEYHSPVKAGFAMLAIEAGGIESRREMVQIIPAATESVHLSSSNQNAASMESVTRISSQPIKDIFGNAISDGMYVALRGQDDEGRVNLYGTVTSNSVASSDIINREIAVKMKLHATLDTVSSADLMLNAEQFSMRDEIGFSMHYENSTHSLIGRFGPMATADGYLLPDGVAAKIEILPGTAKITSVQQINDGFIEARFALAESNKIEIGLEVGNSHFFGHFEPSVSSKTQLLLAELH